uniref:AC transposase n=1 Tax=Triticum urartu TaxID=4572 RepID=A0A8R7TNE6_TRIUA
MASSETSAAPAARSSDVAGHSTPDATPDTSAEEASQGATDGSVRVGNKRRKLPSFIWSDFEKLFVDGEWKAECIYCAEILPAEAAGGTSHLEDHLMSCADWHALAAPQESRLSKAFDGGEADWEDILFDQEVARKHLAMMICAHDYPLSIVNHAGFRKLCYALQPMFQMVSRNDIRKDILGTHAAEKDKMVKYFADFKGRVAISTDMWTAEHQKRGYMVVTAHFLDESWQLKSFMLRFVYVPCPHNAAVICQALHESLVEWHLERKISTVTLDNCIPSDEAMEHLPDKLDLKSLLLEGIYLHMRCGAHMLNLFVKDGMDLMEKSIERVCDSVAYWSATPGRHDKFEKMAQTLNIEYKERLFLDCKTRWNSTYRMLTIALEYIEIFETLKEREKSFSCCPTKDDWKFAKELCVRLKIYYDVSESFSGTKYVTANMFFRKICCIQLAIRRWAASDSELVQTMSEEMKRKFDKYWKDVLDLMSVATVLDPRYKLHMLQAIFGSLYGTEHAAVEVAKIRKLMTDLLKQYQEADGFVATSEAVSSAASGAGGEDDIMDIFDRYMSSRPTIGASPVQTELDLYLEEQIIRRMPDEDIMTWWKYGGAKYPTLQRIARDILPIPASAVISESAFNTKGRLLSPHRGQLAPSMVEAIMCMKAWSRADMIGDGNSTLCAVFQSVLDDEEEMMDDSESMVTED